MLVIRPAGPDDYNALMELAVLSGPGFTSLPEDEATLRERLEVSQKSFQGELADQEGRYTLMLEDTETGEIDGLSAVKAAVGLHRPFLSFRVVQLAQYSPSLNLRFDHNALVLVNECTGWSEVGSLFLKAHKRKGGAGRLLAQSRYLLIGAAPERFSDMVLAELRGWLDENDVSPFWEHVAHKFFRMSFIDADRLSGSTDGQFMLDLAPRHAIYTELLHEDARRVIGECHPHGQAALALLESEGFRKTGLVDVFDAGPTVACRRDDLRTIRDSVVRKVRISPTVDATPKLVAVNDLGRFRATRAPVELDMEHADMSADVADLLQVKNNDWVRIKA